MTFQFPIRKKSSAPSSPLLEYTFVTFGKYSGELFFLTLPLHCEVGSQVSEIAAFDFAPMGL
jgi:hypothetical protein